MLAEMRSVLLYCFPILTDPSILTDPYAYAVAPPVATCDPVRRMTVLHTRCTNSKEINISSSEKARSTFSIKAPLPAAVLALGKPATISSPPSRPPYQSPLRRHCPSLFSCYDAPNTKVKGNLISF